jgi:4-hydroxy-3-polyprenylbenzoate decarboxylase
MDGGAFITLPQVFSLPPGGRNMMKSNIGMYRVQLSGNQYVQDKEIGLHYQLHRGIGVHHTEYNTLEEPFRVSIFVGGLPSPCLLSHHAFA